ncbi:SAM-dependent methyltransferase [Isoptericola cucumis]|uniref:SAM-dependent methyltransferase n=1 Tax=Isoptericola cucumis TaxID=1776856 RepID=A0ABQ2B5D3_9MICO|nr:class I SAM-dependent methyltransferase [Isoptericola cucumis]GGI05942.1 SAM-dependent methyltransferase [Isoptericola cucumis]
MPQDDDDLRTSFDAAASALTFNAPLGEPRAADLLDRLAPSAADARALDLGCGSGELLLRVCDRHGLAGDGVDQQEKDLDRARLRAADLGVADRVSFHAADATTWDRPADLVLNVGAAHIWDGADAALAALHRVTRPGGTLLFGDGIYEREPDAACREIFGDMPDLAGTARAATAAGFRVLHAATSTTGEWDDFESDWRAGIERVATPGARELADRRREEYLGVYRGVVGFAWLVLTPA